MSDNLCRHPCTEKPSVVADIGLRLQEGIQELKLEQQLAPAREAVARTLATGSTSFFKAVEGVRERWTQRQISTSSSTSTSTSGVSDASGLSTPVEVSRSDLDGHNTHGGAQGAGESPKSTTLRPFSLLPSFGSPTPGASSSPTGGQEHARSASAATTNTGTTTASPASTWGAGIGSFFSSRLARARSTEPIPAPSPGSAEKSLPPVNTSSGQTRSRLPPLPSPFGSSPPMSPTTLPSTQLMPAEATATSTTSTATLSPGSRSGFAKTEVITASAHSPSNPRNEGMGKDQAKKLDEDDEDGHIYTGVAL